jgi:hypothetical protein
MNDQDPIRRETMLVAWTALAFALVALAYCVRHGTLLLYGDAVAHLHIARRVFDSITPGSASSGLSGCRCRTFFLCPLSGIWRGGIAALAGACVSIPSYVLGCARESTVWPGCGWIGPPRVVVVAFYGLNPGLLYMATTAMTEPLFLAEMIWARAADRSVSTCTSGLLRRRMSRPPFSRLLIGAGLVLVCAIFTRYDGWVYAAVAWLFATLPLLARSPPVELERAGRRRLGACLPPC